MLVADQFIYDDFNSKRRRIFRVNIENLDENFIETGDKFATAPMPLREELKAGYVSIEEVVRFKRGFGNSWIELENNNIGIPLFGYFADPEVLQVFEYALEFGDPVTALNEPYSLVLSKKAARKLFKKENPLGETIRVGDEVYKITGVLQDTKNKSHINFEALASMATVKSIESRKDAFKELDNWQSCWNGWVYVLGAGNLSKEELQIYLNTVQKNHYKNGGSQARIKFSVQAITEITPGPFLKNPIGPMLPWGFIYFIAGLALIIIVSSCFNFTNLSIAKSLSRAKEIGVRKTSGATRGQVFVQFISESVLMSWVALVVAFVFLMLMKPLVFNFKIAQMLKWDWEINYPVILIFILFAGIIGVFAGFFPAVVISKYQPIKILRGISSVHFFSRMNIRKILIVIQFSFSLIFVLTLIVGHNQLKMFLNSDYGFYMKNKICLKLNKTSSSILKNELSKYSNIEDVAAASHLVASGTTYGANFRANHSKNWTYINYYSVDEDYQKNMGLQMVSGRFFDPKAGTANKGFIILNEKALAALNYSQPNNAIGETLMSNKDSANFEIIGVVKDYNHQTLTQQLDPLVLIYNPKEYNILQIRYRGDYKAAATSVDQAWSKASPSLRAEFNDFEEEVKKSYHLLFGDFVHLIFYISIVAVLLTCLGLLGMAVSATEARTKEISIRKVFGSSNFSLIFLLSKPFLMLLTYSILIAVPMAYFVINIWLQTIAYHTSFDISVILNGICILFILTCITVFSQTFRAKSIKPIDNLRSE